MTESTIQCPRCNAAIPLSEALIAQVRATVETDLDCEHDERLRKAVRQAQARANEQVATEERRAMEKLWNERAKQIERLTVNTVAMHGAIRGAIGSQLPELPALELEALPHPEVSA
jgi:hypothetical protein